MYIDIFQLSRFYWGFKWDILLFEAFNNWEIFNIPKKCIKFIGMDKNGT